MTLTPEQFNTLITKEEFNELRKEMADKNDVNTILTGIDGVTKKLNDIEHAFVSNLAAHDRFEKIIARTEEHLKLDPMYI